MFSYIFALLPPFFDSTINYLDKFILSKYNVDATILTIYSGLFAFFTGVLVFLFHGLLFFDVLTMVSLIVAGFCGVCILLAYFKALTLDDASRVGSLFQLVPVFVIFLSIVLLQEQFTVKQYIGCAFVIVAGFSFSIRKFNKDIISVNSAFWYMVLASLLSAAVYILYKVGVTTTGFWDSIPYEGLGSGLAALSILLWGNNLKNMQKFQKKITKKIFFYFTLTEAIYRVSRFSFYYALLIIPASIVSVLQGFQPVFLLLMGLVLSLRYKKLFNELFTKETIGMRIGSIMGIFVGLVLLFL